MSSPRRLAWPVSRHLSNHWRWRPEWTAERACLYWYVVFEPSSWPEPVHRALSALSRVRWLDSIPARWLHLTLTDVGFVDELDPDTVRSVVAEVADTLADQRPLRLRLEGPVVMSSAAVMAAEPLEPLRGLHEKVVDATRRSAGPAYRPVHGPELWPHVSLAYANSDADADAVTDAVAVAAPGQRLVSEASVDTVSLASVTRRNRHYQWRVEATIPLGRSPALPGPAPGQSR